MTLFVCICVFAAVSAIAGILIAFSPSRAVLAVSSVVLSALLSILGILVLNVSSIFWLVPTYLLLDVITLYFLFSTGLQSGVSQTLAPKTKLKFVVIASGILLVFAMATWEVWRLAEVSLPSLDDAVSPMHLWLWEGNLPMVMLCFLLLAPVSIGALLMVRPRD